LGTSPRRANRRLSRLQFPGGLHLGHAPQVAKHDGKTELLGQPGKLFVDRRQQFVRLGRSRGRDCDSHFSHSPFLRSPPSRDGIGLDRDPVGDPVQPAPQGVSLPDRAGLFHQDQERGLERVLGVVRFTQDPPADAQDHRPVPRHQRLDGPGIPLAEEPLKELRVRQSRKHALRKQAVEISQGNT
jgi:hypothetical protein